MNSPSYDASTGHPDSLYPKAGSEIESTFKNVQFLLQKPWYGND